MAHRLAARLQQRRPAVGNREQRLQEAGVVSAAAAVADIASGTGLLAKIFLRGGDLCPQHFTVALS